jgi:hypothetical protein
MLWLVLAWRMFWNFWTIYFFNFPIFLGLQWTADTELVDMGAHLYILIPSLNMSLITQQIEWGYSAQAIDTAPIQILN